MEWSNKRNKKQLAWDVSKN